MLKSFTKTFAFLALTVLLACSANEENKQENLSADQFYNRAMENLQKKQYKDSISDFQKIEQIYPYSQWATKGKIMAAYSSYKAGEYEDAINYLDSYIKLHPGNSDIAYAYYLKALCYYERIADVRRDQQISEQALASLKEVGKRFPDTDYGRDAKLKLDLVLDHLAGKEMEIGRYYLKQKKFIAAINRFRTVIERFDTTSHVPEALYRLTETYTTIGMKDDAEKYAAVLGYNYPDNKWYRYSYNLVQNGSPKKPAAPSLKKD